MPELACIGSLADVRFSPWRPAPRSSSVLVSTGAPVDPGAIAVSGVIVVSAATAVAGAADAGGPSGKIVASQSAATTSGPSWSTST